MKHFKRNNPKPDWWKIIDGVCQVFFGILAIIVCVAIIGALLTAMGMR